MHRRNRPLPLAQQHGKQNKYKQKWEKNKTFACLFQAKSRKFREVGNGRGVWAQQAIDG